MLFGSVGFFAHYEIHLENFPSGCNLDDHMSQRIQEPPMLKMLEVLEPGQLDSVFPQWNNIQIQGAPGAGKSFLCRRLRKSQGVMTTADDQTIRHLIDIEASRGFGY